MQLWPYGRFPPSFQTILLLPAQLLTPGLLLRLPHCSCRHCCCCGWPYFSLRHRWCGQRLLHSIGHQSQYQRCFLQAKTRSQLLTSSGDGRGAGITSSLRLCLGLGPLFLSGFGGSCRPCTPPATMSTEGFAPRQCRLQSGYLACCFAVNCRSRAAVPTACHRGSACSGKRLSYASDVHPDVECISLATGRDT